MSACRPGISAPRRSPKRIAAAGAEVDARMSCSSLRQIRQLDCLLAFDQFFDDPAGELFVFLEFVRRK